LSKAFDHTIKGNKGSARPVHVIFADVESRLSPQPDGKTLFTPFLWTMIYRRYRKADNEYIEYPFSGTSIDDFWELVDGHCYAKTKSYLVTHHLEVDFMPLKGFTQLQARGWELEKLISHNRVLIMFWRCEKRSLIIMNNGNLFDGSIEGWGKVLGIDKLEMPDQDAPLADWVTYCMRDTVILCKMWELLYNFIDLHDLGNFKLTKAALAISAFRHRFMSTEIAIHDDGPTLLLERLSYKGGRFEALKIGTFSGDTFYNLDINSMYGYIEKNAKLPYELRGYTDKPTMRSLLIRLKKYAIVADVEIEPTEPIFPHKENEKIVYAAGRFRTVLTTPEIVYCVKRGWVRALYTMAWYYQADILSEYAAFFLDLKSQYDRENNQPMRQMTKLYLNSLYGKFAQHGYEDKIIGDCDPGEFSFIESFNAQTHLRTTIARYGGHIHETIVTQQGYNTFISIASHITAFGRLMLWDLMQAAGLENVYHVATDSLVVNSVGYANLSSYLDARTPGRLKVEKTFTTLTVKDVNDTIQDITVKIKGIPKKAVQLSENSYQVTAWPRMLTLLKGGITDYYYTRTETKVLSRPRYYQLQGVPNPDLAGKALRKRTGVKMAKLQDPFTVQTIALIDGLREARKISPVDMLRLWDYKTGQLRKQRTLRGNLREFEYSDVHFIAWQYGFTDIDELAREVQNQVDRDREIKRLRALLRAGQPGGDLAGQQPHPGAGDRDPQQRLEF
jgi:hypothetical protein